MITALVGGQYGSEGKGAIVGAIAKDHEIHVRVGAANAGHTVYTINPRDGTWEKHVMQQLPCAAYANPYAQLVLGAGAMISPEILENEIELNRVWRKERDLPQFRVLIDRRAHVVREEHKLHEQTTNLAESIGSTSTIAREGIGSAQAARALRFGYEDANGYFRGSYRDLSLVDTVEFLQQADRSKRNILLEGTQGTSLSNITGPYPFVTSRCTTAPGLLADTGLARLDDVIMVCRSFPIRVAGNSGPFWPDSIETSWNSLGVDEENERTTVTKKIRRVATLSVDQLVYNARLNGATQIAYTFADYVNASLAGYDPSKLYRWGESDRWDRVSSIIREIETETGVPVTMVGAGPYTILRRRSLLEARAASS